MAKVVKLPKAPLVEVVFEMHWVLQTGPDGQPVLQSDPGIIPLIEQFTEEIKKSRYRAILDMSHPLATAPHSVARRFYLAPDKPFPLMQIGPGIFATNDGPQYSWPLFKSQAKAGVRALLASYPKLDFFKLQPNYLELRYIDSLDSRLSPDMDFFSFANNATALKFQLPPILENRKVVSGQTNGRLSFGKPLKNWKDSQLNIDIASGTNNVTKGQVVRLETKVIANAGGVPSYSRSNTFISQLDKWLEFAHGFTSPFFRQLLLPEAMAHFEEA